MMLLKRTMGLALGVAGASVAIGRIARSRRRIDFAGKTVVIFGASRGLGLVLARQFSGEGANLVIVARDQDELKQADADLQSRGYKATVIACDIRNRAQVDAAIGHVIREHQRIDVLVNNAGIIQVSPLEHLTLRDFEDAMATHFWGPLYTITAAVPHMRHAGARRIVNISSIGGKIAVPHLLPYSASKFALTGLSEGLGVELAREGFRVTTVCPGLMRTGSTYNAHFKGQHQREFAWFHVFDSLPGISVDARVAARRIIDACRYGDPELVITPTAKMAILLQALGPNWTARLSSIANRLLPAPGQESGDEERLGWESASNVAPSFLTKLSDRATIENGELPLSTAGVSE